MYNFLSRILLVGIIFFFVVIPVSADLEQNTTIDGKIRISNDSYWIEWDHIDNHTLGDRFFVNATTNFPIGTDLTWEFWAVSHDCHTKLCTFENYASTGNMVIESIENNTINETSVLIDTNTDDLQFGEYIFGFRMNSTKLNPQFPPEEDYFTEINIILNTRETKTEQTTIPFLTVPPSPDQTIQPINQQKNEKNYSQTPHPTPAPLSFLPVSAGLLISLAIIFRRQKKTE